MSAPAERQGSGLRWSAWNFLLLVPLLVLVTPIFNFARPTLLGIPFFYWFQLLYVLVGVISVSIVVAMTDKGRIRTITPGAKRDENRDQGVGE